MAPLTTQVSELSLARANESIFTQPLGNLVIDVVNAAKDVHLTLGSGSLTQKANRFAVAGRREPLPRHRRRVGNDGVSGTGALVLQTRRRIAAQVAGCLAANQRWLAASGRQQHRRVQLTASMTCNGVTLVGDAKIHGDTQWLVGGDTRFEAGTTLDATGKAVITTSSLVMAPDSGLKRAGPGGAHQQRWPYGAGGHHRQDRARHRLGAGGVQAAQAGTGPDRVRRRRCGALQRPQRRWCRCGWHR